MEKRFVLTSGESAKIAGELIIETAPTFIIDEYTGEKRIRKADGETIEGEYQTPVKGKIYRYSFKSNYKNTPCWKENIPGWDILK